MKNKVERRLIRCKKSKETVLFLLVDSENLSSADDVKKAAKELLRASKKMGKGLGKPAILVGGSSATDQIWMDKVVRILKKASSWTSFCFRETLLVSFQRPMRYYSAR